MIILVAHYCWYHPLNYPLSGLEPQIGQVLVLGGYVVGIALFTCLWPAAGGIIAILYGGLSIYHFWGMLQLGSPQTLIPVPDFYMIYTIFIVSGAINFVAGIRRKPDPLPESPKDKWLRRIARITAFIPIPIAVIIFTIVYPSPFLMGTIPGLIFVCIAWFWPAPGGLLMLFMTVPGFYTLLESNYDFQMKLPAYILCLVYIAGGLLHLAAGFRIVPVSRLKKDEK